MSVVNYKVEQNVAVIEMNNPPVNGLGAALRRAIVESVDKAQYDDSVKAIVITGSGRFFSAGADVTEFNTPKAGLAPNLMQVIGALEDSRKPVVAAVNGIALGGGLELSLGAHYRVAKSDAKVGLPEVKIGLLPGAGGTQRLPRAIGVEKALRMIVTGQHVPSPKLADSGLFEKVVDDNVVEEAIKLALEKAASGEELPKVRDRKVPDASNAAVIYKTALETISNDRKLKHLPAPKLCLEAVRASTEMPFEQGMTKERNLFNQLVMGTESQALRHVFFAERESVKIPGIDPKTPVREIRKVGVIGAGTMGGGITMNFLSAGIPVTIVETKQEALDRGVGIIRKNYENTAKKGRITEEAVEKAMSLLSTSLDYNELSNADLIIEAVFERMDVKKSVFEQIDKVAKQGAILATNTSTLDVNEIASVTGRPQDVVGTHFFSPANVMKLLEVVRGDKTADDVLVTVLELGKKIGKKPVVAGVCDGFIGNRMLHAYYRAANQLVIDGATPHQVDSALEARGFAMGPFRVGDLAGLDIGYSVRQEQKAKNPDAYVEQIADRIVEKDRLGQKNGKGWYRYEAGDRTPHEDPEVDEIIQQFRSDLGVEPRSFTENEIFDRCVFSLINEGSKILEEGIALRASDIDVVYLNGYGYPLHQGGPMNYAQQIGIYNVVRGLERFAHEDPDQAKQWQPSKLLKELAESGETFKEYEKAHNGYKTGA